MKEITNTGTSATEKPYELRALEARDVFLMSKIIKSIGVKQLRDCFSAEAIDAMTREEGEQDEKLLVAAGAEVFLNIADVVLMNIGNCEEDIYAFLANLSGFDKEEVAALPMNTFVEMIIDVVKKDEFGDFIKVVSKLFK